MSKFWHVKCILYMFCKWFSCNYAMTTWVKEEWEKKSLYCLLFSGNHPDSPGNGRRQRDSRRSPCRLHDDPSTRPHLQNTRRIGKERGIWHRHVGKSKNSKTKTKTYPKPFSKQLFVIRSCIAPHSQILITSCIHIIFLCSMRTKDKSLFFVVNI